MEPRPKSRDIADAQMLAAFHTYPQAIRPIMLDALEEGMKDFDLIGFPRGTAGVTGAYAKFLQRAQAHLGFYQHVLAQQGIHIASWFDSQRKNERYNVYNGGSPTNILFLGPMRMQNDFSKTLDQLNQTFLKNPAR